LTTTTSHHTPPVPGAVRPLFDALAVGDLDAAAASVPEGALAALPGAGGVETDARIIADDRPGLRAALEPAFGARRAEPLAWACTSGPDACLLEGRLLDATGVPRETYLASIHLRGGLIERLLVFSCPLVEPSRAWSAAAAEGSPRDARAVVDRYFELLDASEFEAAADCFSEQVLYSHPPYGPGQPRAEFRGRAELLEGFRRRGPKPDREHHIERSPQRGGDCFLEGFTVDEPRGGSFISSLSLDPDGRIERYLAVYCEPVVP
jgi:hypothetical protein